jgi:hypothetical protein
MVAPPGAARAAVAAATCTEPAERAERILQWRMVMEAASSLWERVRNPRGPVGRLVKRAGLSAVGTYTAYLVHGLRHPDLLRPAIAPVERTDELPGDDLVARPDWTTNFAVDIAAAPQEVWPWLLQIGYGRAGWYTWFPLDNGGTPSAEVIVRALQDLKVGDVVPDGARSASGFGLWRVHSLVPARALVLYSRRNPVTGHEVSPGREDGESFIDCSWVFVLSETAPGRTRLRVRVRAQFRGKAWIAPVMRGARLLFGLGDNVMENTMLAGIRERAERHPRRFA